MTSFLDGFDATNIKPQQGFDTHPPGMFDAQVSHTYLNPTKDNQGLMFVVEFTTAAGRIESRYNVYNKSPQAMEIAQKELSALCHATGVFRLTNPKNPDGSPIMDQAGRELRGARCKIEVVPQTNKDGTPNGYMEVKKVYDSAGNEPGKPAGAPQPMQQPMQQAQPQPQQQAPMQQQPSGGWGPAPQQQQQAPQGGWGNPQPQAQPQQQATSQPNNNAPPWAR